MSDLTPKDPRVEQAGASDESLQAAHEKLLGRKPDDGAHYKMLPLVLLFVFSGLIFYAGTYLNQYSARYDATVFNENGHSTKGVTAVAKIDPMVLGKKNFELVCATCHQVTGLGVPGVYPPLAESEWVNGSEERLIRIVLHGLKGPVSVKGTVYSAAAMPVFGKVAASGYNWSDDKIAAVLTYIRASFGNKAPAVTSEQVAAIHAKEADRKEWSAEELLKLP
ncbi:MAG: Cytochrome c [Verrucomicrobia bacterium]|nr:MAG: Cytochrome c [Verrucomicrobiota bacterium]